MADNYNKKVLSSFKFHSDMTSDNFAFYMAYIVMNAKKSYDEENRIYTYSRIPEKLNERIASLMRHLENSDNIYKGILALKRPAYREAKKKKYEEKKIAELVENFFKNPPYMNTLTFVDVKSRPWDYPSGPCFDITSMEDLKKKFIKVYEYLSNHNDDIKHITGAKVVITVNGDNPCSCFRHALEFEWDAEYEKKYSEMRSVIDKDISDYYASKPSGSYVGD